MSVVTASYITTPQATNSSSRITLESQAAPAKRSRFSYRPPNFSQLSLGELSLKVNTLQEQLRAQISMLGSYLTKYQTDINPGLISLYISVENGFQKDITALCKALANQDNLVNGVQIPIIKKLMEDFQLQMKRFIEISEKNKIAPSSEVKNMLLTPNND